MQGNGILAAAGAALAMVAIVALRYLATSGLFAWLGERRWPGLHRGLAQQIRREIGWSLASAAIYGLPAGIVAWGWQNRGWTQIYQDASAYPLWWMPLSFLLCLLIHDTWFYWTHRWMHAPRLLRAIHAVHHDSRPPTAWAAMSFHPGEALTGAFVIPALVFVLPLHVGVVMALLLTMTLMGRLAHPLQHFQSGRLCPEIPVEQENVDRLGAQITAKVLAIRVPTHLIARSFKPNPNQFSLILIGVSVWPGQ